jgi:regulatory protein
MSKITEIKEQRRQKDRLSLFIDGDFWTGMSKDLFIELQLHNGQELSRAEIKEIESRVVEDSALNYALNRLSRVMTSEKILEEKLQERGYGPEVIAQVIDRCRQLALINDQLMAENLAAEAQRRQRGPRWLATKLREKGLGAEQEVLEQFSAADQYRAAEEALLAMIGDQRLDRRQQQQKLRTLINRGFAPGAAQQAINKYQLSDEEERQVRGVDQARQELEKKYRGGVPVGKRSQAYAFLLRRGYLSDVASEALRLNSD